MPALSTAAKNILCAERADQIRIDRDAFTQAFKHAVESKQAALFRFPSDAHIDGQPVLQWCEAHARLHDGLKIARCDIQPTAAVDQASIIAQLIEQLGQHLPACSDDVAMQSWRTHMSSEAHDIVTVIVVDAAYDEKLLTPVIEAATERPASAPCRVVLLLSPAAIGPASTATVNATVSNGELFARADVIAHLQKSWGYDAAQSEHTYSLMDASGVTARPASVYGYVRGHCGIAASVIP
jgi:hypothetical protein